MTWLTYTCEISNKPAIVMIDQQFENRFPVPELPWLSWFGVYCNLPPDGACWAEAETESLDYVEDQLIELAGQFGRGWAVYVFRIVTPGIREYYIYHSAEAEMSKAYDALKVSVPNYRIEVETTNDASWEQYRRYSAFKEKESPLLGRFIKLFGGRE
ncbi:MAG: DUF695 domain-containing protein [Cyanobacteria bacterium SZAS TMP-1]|nr:DUF695 domain-containing protein [Cyanobacteria bacterium SZAS TMP-1]